jgi:hypothetical protein
MLNDSGLLIRTYAVAISGAWDAAGVLERRSCRRGQRELSSEYLELVQRVLGADADSTG